MVSNPDLYAYLSTVLGRPWERHGLHCWRVVVQVQRDLFGRELPFAEKDMVKRAALRELMGQQAEGYGWHEVEEPVHGAVARMYRMGGNPADLEHAGVYLDVGAGMVIHSDHPHGVVLDGPLELKARGWIARWFVPNDSPEMENPDA